MSSEKLDELPVTTQKTERLLNDRQLTDYSGLREDFLTWMLYFGKAPSKAEGYSIHTVKNRAYRTDAFFRWCWRQGDEDVTYSMDISHDDADAYVKHLTVEEEYGNDHMANTQKALKCYFKWRAHEHDGEEWEEPSITYSNSGSTTAKREFLDKSERRQIREASLSLDDFPHYNAVTPEKRERINKLLSHRLGITQREIGPAHWEEASGYKIPSLVWVSMDAGLRPIEVSRARTSWVDLDDGMLRIPQEDAAKDANQGWDVSLKDRTTNLLKEWLEERAAYPKYDETDSLWLTLRGNPFDSHNLSHLMKRLMDEQGIEHENRETGWYIIRRSTATYFVSEGELSTAQTQLRHEDPKTTMRYDQSPPEVRKDVLDKID